MKMYSSTAVTKSDVEAIDAKQTQQIKQLRLWLLASFIGNAALAIALHFL